MTHEQIEHRNYVLQGMENYGGDEGTGVKEK